MVLNLSWSCSRSCRRHGTHAEVSGTGAESRRGRENHPLGDDVPHAQPTTGRSQHSALLSVFSMAARLTVLLNLGLSSPTGETTTPSVLPDGRQG
jgi:hypothetical protein